MANEIIDYADLIRIRITAELSVDDGEEDWEVTAEAFNTTAPALIVGLPPAQVRHARIALVGALARVNVLLHIQQEYKQLPGDLLIITTDAGIADGQYHDCFVCFMLPKRSPRDGDPDRTIDEARAIMEDAVKRVLQADADATI